ncbi:hypothetical protein AMTRI_Chr02g261050 [Amborella trichopoda]
MSLRHWVRMWAVSSLRGMKDQAPKWKELGVRSLQSNGRIESQPSFSTQQVKKFSRPALDSSKRKRTKEQRRGAEESLRTVIYLSTWGPN